MVEFDTGAFYAKAANVSNGFTEGFLWVLVFGAVGGIIFLIWWIISHKHVVIVRVKTQTRKYIRVDKAKPVVRRGIPQWHLLKLKRYVTPPPPEAIEITQKGRYHVECYWSDENPEPVWIFDNGTANGFLEPFTTQERALHVEAVTRAALRKKKGWLELIGQLAMPFAFIILIISVFVFWGDLTAPSLEAQKQNAKITESQAKITEQQVLLMGEMVRVMGELNLEATKLNMTITQTIEAS